MLRSRAQVQKGRSGRQTKSGASAAAPDPPWADELCSSSMSDQLKLVTTVGNEAEAEMVSARLSEAGIRFTVRLASGGIRLGAAASRDL